MWQVDVRPAVTLLGYELCPQVTGPKLRASQSQISKVTLVFPVTAVPTDRAAGYGQLVSHYRTCRSPSQVTLILLCLSNIISDCLLSYNLC